MVVVLRLALSSFYSSSKPCLWSWVVLAGKGYRVGVEWGKVRVSCECTWEVVWEEKPWEMAGKVLAGTGWYCFMVAGF
ncbi:hypothetical protein Tco_1267618 [Tanacetum coccineum]